MATLAVVTKAKQNASMAPSRRLPMRNSDPSGPRLALSKAWRWLRGRGRSRKCFHLSWPRQALTASSIDVLPTMTRMEMTVLGWMKKVHRDRAQPSHRARTATRATMAAMLPTTAAISAHHHEWNVVARLTPLLEESYGTPPGGISLDVTRKRRSDPGWLLGPS